MAHAISDLYPLIRLECPGIPEPILQAEVQDSIDSFLADSEAWKYTIPTVLDWETTQKFPTITVGVDIPANTRVVRYDTVKFANDGTSFREVPFRTRQQLDGEYSDWEVRTGNTPLVWTVNGLFAPLIVPIATQNVLSSLIIRVVLGTDRAVTVLPEFLIHEFGDVIQYDVLSKLLLLPGKDWTNVPSGLMYKRMYDDQIPKIKSRAQADYGQPNSRIMAYGGI
jgi:hypothetical protein